MKTAKLGLIGLTAAAVLLATITSSARQSPTVLAVDEATLREYAGVFQWGPDSFLYLQMWNEFAGANQLVAFDESGDVRTLYPIGRDQFFAGPGAAISTSIESRIDFQRDN